MMTAGRWGVKLDASLFTMLKGMFSHQDPAEKLQVFPAHAIHLRTSRAWFRHALWISLNTAIAALRPLIHLPWVRAATATEESSSSVPLFAAPELGKMEFPITPFCGSCIPQSIRDDQVIYDRRHKAGGSIFDRIPKFNPSVSRWPIISDRYYCCCSTPTITTELEPWADWSSI